MASNIDINEIMSIINSKFDNIYKKMDCNQVEVMASLKAARIYVCAEVKNVFEEIKKVKSDLLKLEDRIDLIEREKLANDLVITGVPDSQNTNVYGIVTNICNALEIKSKTSTIHSVFRLTSKNKNKLNMSLIIIKFITRKDKMFFYNTYIKFKNSNLSHIGFSSTSRIYCNDGLTKRNSQIFHQAKLLQNQNHINKVTTKRGQIFVTLHSESSVHIIKSIENLNELIVGQQNNESSNQSTGSTQPTTMDSNNSCNSRTLLSRPHYTFPTTSHVDAINEGQVVTNVTVSKSPPISVAAKIDNCVDEIFENCCTPPNEPARSLRPRKPV